MDMYCSSREHVVLRQRATSGMAEALRFLPGEDRGPAVAQGQVSRGRTGPSRRGLLYHPEILSCPNGSLKEK